MKARMAGHDPRAALNCDDSSPRIHFFDADASRSGGGILKTHDWAHSKKKGLRAPASQLIDVEVFSPVWFAMDVPAWPAEIVASRAASAARNAACAAYEAWTLPAVNPLPTVIWLAWVAADAASAASLAAI